MTLSWPDDAEVRRVVAAWGQLLDEGLLADGGVEAPSLDWPEDAVIAGVLAEWGQLVDAAVDAATCAPDFDPTMAWLGGSLDDGAGDPIDGCGDPGDGSGDPGDGSGDLGDGAVAESPATSMLPTDISGLAPSGGPRDHRSVRRRKRVHPGPAVSVEGWVELVDAAGVHAGVRRRWNRVQRWSQVVVAAAATTVLLLIGGQAIRHRDQSYNVGIGTEERSGTTGTTSPAGPAPGSTQGGRSRPSGSTAAARATPSPPAAGDGQDSHATGTPVAASLGSPSPSRQVFGGPGTKLSTPTTAGNDTTTATTGSASGAGAGAVYATTCRNSTSGAGGATTSSITPSTVSAIAVTPRSTTTTAPQGGSGTTPGAKMVGTTNNGIGSRGPARIVPDPSTPSPSPVCLDN